LILIIAEKPSVAGEIAKVVGATKREKGYLSGGNYLVSWCVGHLIEMAQPAAYDEKLKKWSLDTLPILPDQYITEVSSNTADQFKVLKELMRRTDVTELIEATDAGREGELIFRLVYDKASCKKPFKRLWISSMEEKSIKDGLAKMKPSSAYDSLYRAALCRQRADWLVGINLTRLYSKMYDKTLTCGRVQTPTINLIVERQREIENFVPQIYYSLIADLGSFKAYTKATKKEDAQEIVSRCTGKKAYVTSVEKQEKKENPAALYDLTTLQRDANRLLGYSAQQTLDYMQKLYDGKLATYPRTDSRYITADQEAHTRSLIDTLLQTGIYSTIISSDYSTDKISMKRIVNDKKVTDHHAILPTESVTKEKLAALPTGERNILLLVSYRLLSAVYSPYVYTATKAILDIEGEAFSATGREILETGFKMIDGQLKNTINATEEKEEKQDGGENAMLPPMAEGNKFTVIGITAEEKKTQPPKSYTEDTLLSAMETAGKSISDSELKEAMKDSGLGTPATRAGIIENIIKTGYISREGKKLLPTETAYTFIDLVTPTIKQPELTAEWEKQLSEIQRGEIADTVFMDQITGFIRSFVNDTKALYSPEQSTGVFERERENIGTCPICGKKVVEFPKSYSCESGKGGCGFVIWKTIAGKAISITQATKLLNKGKTDLIKGFKSKEGKPFDAYLILKENKSVGFDFPPRK
jgi:DNA topoisomerase-3